MSNNYLFQRNAVSEKRSVFHRWLPLLAALLLACSSVFSQQSQTPYDIAGKSMNYYPASVEAASLFRRVPDEVDYARGRVTVRIPLYTIKTRNFTLPISISYTTGGIKADQKSGRVGLGWQLEAEPMISREVRGLRDEQSYLLDSSYYATDPLAYEALVGAGTKDLLPDFFHYRTLTGSGKFILNMTDNYQFHPELLNQEYVRLSTPQNKVAAYFDNEIRLIDDRGSVYSYGKSTNSREFTRMGSGMRTITCWKVSDITSLDGECLSFSYKEYYQGERTKSNYDYYGLEDRQTPDPYGLDNVLPPSPGYWKGVDGYEEYYQYDKTVKASDGSDSAVFKKWFYTPQIPANVYAPLDVTVDLRLIETINFPNGRVTFTYSDEDKTLQDILVYNTNGKRIKQIHFTRHSEGFERYLLDAVEIKDEAGGTVEKYRFDYYGLPAGAPAFSPYTKAVDYWGYFNGHTENTDLVPRQTVEFKLSNNATKRTITIGGGICKDPSFEHARAYSLASVFYPTGGQTTFQYEPNRILWYLYPGIHYPAGGLRIARIEDRTKMGELATVRSFRYKSENGIEGIGYMRYPLAPWNYEQRMKKTYLITQTDFAFNSYRRDYRLYSPTSKVCPDNSDIYYEIVEETTGDGVVKHVFDDIYRFWTSSFYYPGEHEEHFDEPLYKGDDLTSGGVHEYYKNGTLEKSVSEGVRESVYDRLIDLEKTSVVVNYTRNQPGDKSVEEDYRNTFKKKNISALTVTTRNAGNGTTTYTPQGKLTESTRYSQAGNWQIREKKVVSSDGSVHSIRYTYPFDYSGEPYRSMVEKSDISVPVEEQHYEDGVLKKKIKRVYTTTPTDTPSLNGYHLTKLQETTDAGSSVFNDVESYDSFLYNGMPVQLTKRDGTIVSLIWGYEYQHLLAIVEDATIEEVKSRLGTDISALAQSTQCSDSMYTRLESLQTSLPQARTTVFHYRPLVGITQITSPDGRKTFYEYDSAGRLQTEKDTDSETVNTYEYYEKNK